jgi:hypothetical protein
MTKTRIKNTELSVGVRNYRQRKYISLALLPQITFTRLECFYYIEIRFLCIGLHAEWTKL